MSRFEVRWYGGSYNDPRPILECPHITWEFGRRELFGKMSGARTRDGIPGWLLIGRVTANSKKQAWDMVREYWPEGELVLVCSLD